MDKKVIIWLVVFTTFVSVMYIIHNPNIAANLTDDYAEGEVFLPANNHYEFKTFGLNSTAKNFTAKIITNGHAMLIDDKGDTTINVVELDHMINSQRDEVNHTLSEELKNNASTVDGISVHQIDFPFRKSLYAAYLKNSTINTIIYLSTPDKQKTADMTNSLEFIEKWFIY